MCFRHVNASPPPIAFRSKGYPERSAGTLRSTVLRSFWLGSFLLLGSRYMRNRITRLYYSSYKIKNSFFKIQNTTAEILFGRVFGG